MAGRLAVCVVLALAPLLLHLAIGFVGTVLIELAWLGLIAPWIVRQLAPPATFSADLVAGEGPSLDGRPIVGIGRWAAWRGRVWMELELPDGPKTRLVEREAARELVFRFPHDDPRLDGGIDGVDTVVEPHPAPPDDTVVQLYLLLVAVMAGGALFGITGPDWGWLPAVLAVAVTLRGISLPFDPVLPPVPVRVQIRGHKLVVGDVSYTLTGAPASLQPDVWGARLEIPTHEGVAVVRGLPDTIQSIAHHLESREYGDTNDVPDSLRRLSGRREVSSPGSG
ncbi:MAG: hypothetical protein H6736_16860 [Alphaproteobacteria bacterium]|nr:hypothetical protein [Alphaproteobacteria bacterium]